MRITVKYACGHSDDQVDPNTSNPACRECGETRVARVNAPPPTFSGTVKSPHKKKDA